jgi:hypothetical protein
VCENNALKKILESEREKATGGWREVHNEELHNLYSPPSITGMTKSRVIRWTGYVARIGEIRLAYNILVGKYEGKIPAWEN